MSERPSGEKNQDVFRSLPEVPSEVFDLYPYAPGQYGIPFVQIYHLIKFGSESDGVSRSTKHVVGFVENKVSGKVAGGSGQDLDFDAQITQYIDRESGNLVNSGLDFSVKVPYSADMPDFHLKALQGAFWIKTQEEKAKERFPPDGKHPDFRAAAFIKFSLAFYEACGYRTDSLTGEWFPSSANYKMFEENYLKTDDPQEAAKNTWTGRIYSQLGFDSIQLLATTQNRLNQKYIQYVVSKAPLKDAPYIAVAKPGERFWSPDYPNPKMGDWI